MFIADKMTLEKERAVRRFMGEFQNIPAEWARLAAEHLDKDECVAMPMWGTVFMPDSGFAGSIRELLTHPVPTDATDLIEFAEEHGIEIAENEMKLLALCAANDEEAENAESEIDDIRRDLIDAWRDTGSEDAYLADSGWEDVGGTGFVAREIDGELVLGVNGAGYSFLDSHWVRLYDELELKWHEYEG